MFLSFVYLRKGDKGAAAEPFGCAQGRPAQHVGRLSPAWAPVWGPGPCTLLLRVREQASAKLPRRAPVPGEGREEGREAEGGQADKGEDVSWAQPFLMFDCWVAFIKVVSKLTSAYLAVSTTELSKSHQPAGFCRKLYTFQHHHTRGVCTSICTDV